MKTTFKFAVLGTCFVLMLLIDAPPQAPFPGLHMVPTAHAILGVRRRTARRTAVVVASATHAADEQQAAAAPPPAAAVPPPAAAAPPPPATGGAPLPIGTVVAALPGGCTLTPVGDVQYYYCSGNFYRAVMQGTQLVYVTAKP
jgi:hypothetical protein